MNNAIKVNRADLQFDVKVKLRLTLDEVNFLIEAGLTHYDGLCQTVAKDGFLAQWKRNLEVVMVADPTYGMTLSFSQIDLLCKILEQADSSPLYFEFKQLLKRINKAYVHCSSLDL